MTGKVLPKRFAFQVEFAIRFDEPLFAWDCTWNERKFPTYDRALWWPRFNVTVCGVRLGVGLYIGRRMEMPHA